MKRWRTAKNLRQEDIVELDPAFPQERISRIESGKQKLTVEDLVALASIYGRPIDRAVTDLLAASPESLAELTKLIALLKGAKTEDIEKVVIWAEGRLS